MSSERMQAAMKELQESMVILAHIEKTRSAGRDLAQPDSRSEELQRRIEKNLAEITEKLNRLIGPQ
jgi:transcription elongation GreA/GreB family factor